MANEIEAKIRVGSFTHVRKALTKAKAKLLGDVIETDQFFDTPDCRLLKADCGLRLRTTQKKSGIRIRQETGQAAAAASWCGTAAPGCARPQGVMPLLTYKGPRRPGKRIKVRQEIQTNVADAHELTAILEALDFRKSLVVRKHRISYRLNNCRIELDELPGIGRFVEVEGPTQKAVEAVCRKLQLEGERVTQSYVSMVANRLQA